MHSLKHHLVHTHDFLKRGGLFFLFFFLFLCGFFTSYSIQNQQYRLLMSEKIQCDQKLQEALTSYKKVSKEDLNLYVQKTNAMEQIVESKMYFTTSVSYISNTKTKIVISLKGGKSMKADASDLVLSYSPNLVIQEIVPGVTFPSYPRKVVNAGELILTGVASLSGNGIKLGEPNTVFATLIVEKKGNQKQTGILSVDTTRTDIFLEGVSVLDRDALFKKIEI